MNCDRDVSASAGVVIAAPDQSGGNYDKSLPPLLAILYHTIKQASKLLHLLNEQD